MAVQTTIELPESVHQLLSQRAEQSGSSIGTLIVQAVKHAYGTPSKISGQSRPTEKVTGPLIITPGERGPAYPVDENPHDFVFS